MRDIYLPDQITKYKTFTYTRINTCRCAQKQEENMQNGLCLFKTLLICMIVFVIGVAKRPQSVRKYTIIC